MRISDWSSDVCSSDLYIQRDGVTRDGERGQLYSAENDRADGKAFIERQVNDRHQFRFIVSPEDGEQYDDLKPLTRRMIAQMEQDLGTKPDWVAVDHFNTCPQIGRASCRERVCQYVYISVIAVSLQ